MDTHTSCTRAALGKAPLVTCAAKARSHIRSPWSHTQPKHDHGGSISLKVRSPSMHRPVPAGAALGSGGLRRTAPALISQKQCLLPRGGPHLPETKDSKAKAHAYCMLRSAGACGMDRAVAAPPPHTCPPPRSPDLERARYHTLCTSQQEPVACAQGLRCRSRPATHASSSSSVQKQG